MAKVKYNLGGKNQAKSFAKKVNNDNHTPSKLGYSDG
jgi:hypothetical protein